MEERIFSEDVSINRYRLEEECEKHPGVYHYWAEKLAEAKAECDDAELELSRTLASSEIALREGAEVSGKKITENGVKAALEVDAKVKAARDAVKAAFRTRYRIEAGVKALEHKKSELDNLVQLYAKSYYARPDGGPRPTGTDMASIDNRKALNSRKGEDE